MKIKAIEGVRVKAGERLIVVLPMIVSQDRLVQLHEYTKRQGVTAVFLPPGSQLYIQERDAS